MKKYFTWVLICLCKQYQTVFLLNLNFVFENFLTNTWMDYQQIFLQFRPLSFVFLKFTSFKMYEGPLQLTKLQSEPAKMASRVCCQPHRARRSVLQSKIYIGVRSSFDSKAWHQVCSYRCHSTCRQVRSLSSLLDAQYIQWIDRTSQIDRLCHFWSSSRYQHFPFKKDVWEAQSFITPSGVFKSSCVIDGTMNEEIHLQQSTSIIPKNIFPYILIRKDDPLFHCTTDSNLLKSIGHFSTVLQD